MQIPMLACPFKDTSEIDWVQPLKSYISRHYGDDPTKYDDECDTLQRLRQDVRNLDSEHTATKDLLYRYYGQLELLDLRFPVDETHIKISFNWYLLITAYFRSPSHVSQVRCIHSQRNSPVLSRLRKGFHHFQHRRNALSPRL